MKKYLLLLLMTTFILPNQPTTLLIVDSAGRKIVQKEGLQNEWKWDGKNDEGQPVSSGIYLWYINGSKYKGKLIVL